MMIHDGENFCEEMTDKTDSTNRRSPSPDSPFEMATTPAGTNAGLFTVSSKITDQRLSEVAYNEWYEQRRIPDTFKTSGMAEAYRWKALNPEAERPFLNVFPPQDVAFLGSDEFETIPIDDGQLPGSRRIFDLVGFDTRCYRPVQSFEHKAFPASEAAFAVFAECTPIDGDEYRRWCEEEHFAAISKMSTWLRSEHYSLVFATVNMRSIEDQGPGVASRLIVHYFGGERCPMVEAGIFWSNKIMSDMKDCRIQRYRKLFTCRSDRPRKNGKRTRHI